MSVESCPRAWEVEAARDGRLTGHALTRHVAHRPACVACAGDAEALERLARGLREAALLEPDELALRRLRHRVLASFDARHVRRERRVWSSRPLASAGAVLLLLGAGMAFAAWRARALPRPLPPVVASTVVVAKVPEPPPPAPLVEAVTPLPTVRAPRVPTAPMAATAPTTRPQAAEPEDLAYLHVLALLREGRERDARTAARAYMRDFPSGFRRDEMQRIADSP